MGISHEMEEAARIDGCGAFRTYWNIVLPIADSALLVCTVLSIVWHWNDYVEPTMYISFSSLALLPAKLPGLYTLLSSKGVGDAAGSSIDRMVITVEGSVMAATFLVILPILIVYLFLQKKFMESVERTGLVG